MNTGTIESWHAHVYFDLTNAYTIDLLREDIKDEFAAGVDIDRVHYDPIGPHTKPQFCITFDNERFGDLVPWLALNHRGLSVLIHPNTDNEIADHTGCCLWLGTPVPLDLSKL